MDMLRLVRENPKAGLSLVGHVAETTAPNYCSCDRRRTRVEKISWEDDKIQLLNMNLTMHIRGGDQRHATGPVSVIAFLLPELGHRGLSERVSPQLVPSLSWECQLT